MHRRRLAATVVAVAVVVGTLTALTGVAPAAGGALDTTFATSGARIVDFDDFDLVTDLLIQSDGAIVFSADTTSGFALGRLTSAGALDTTFGAAGLVSSTLMEKASGIAEQTDDSIVVAGRSADTDGDLVLARYTDEGDLDTTFGEAGTVEVAMSGDLAGGQDVIALPDDRLVVVAIDDDELVLQRYSADGELDETFGTDGMVHTTVSPGTVDRIARDSTGRLVVTGLGGVHRYSSGGDADTTFGTNGVASTSGHVVWGLDLYSDDRIVTAGDTGSGATAKVMRRLSTGALDLTFGSSGVTSISVPDMSQASARAVAIQDDGKVVVVGRQRTETDSSTIFVARLTATGVLDPTFGSSGIATFTSIGSRGTSNAAALALDGSDRPIVGGSVMASGSSSASDAAIVRITTSDGTTTTTSTSSTTTTTTVLASGGTLRSDPAGSTPSSSRRLVVSLVTGAAGTASISKHTGTAATGYVPLTGASITAPTATATQPHTLTLSMWTGLVPTGFPLGSVVVLRDGAAVARCETTASATPDPCISSFTVSGTALTFTVLTSAASDWTLAHEPLTRLSGDDRVRSAIAASQSAFADEGASAVVLARSDGFADALAATPLAAAKNGPLLLTDRAALDDAVLEEIVRVLPAGGRVYLLGGTAALGAAVEARLTSWGYAHTRYAGRDRFETAVVIAEDGLGAPEIVVETTGLAFPDALTAGAVATAVGGAVLLTNGPEQSGPTLEYLRATTPTRYAIGGPAVEADPFADGIAGTDRYETAALAALAFFPDPEIFGFASGEDFPDALAGGAHIARAGGPLLLVPSTGTLPVPLTIFFDELESMGQPAFLYGGTSAVDSTIEGLLETALGG